jgi:GNAT superfamily N-acetyltransferase
MARIRAASWGFEEYWTTRIGDYLRGELHPKHALAPRVAYVATNGDTVVGLVAGHLTTRHGCDGELEWVDIAGDHRRKGIAYGLLRKLAAWFVKHDANKVCVDVQPENTTARAFYAKHGAVELNRRWMVWNRMDDVAGRKRRQRRQVSAAAAKSKRRARR